MRTAIGLALIMLFAMLACEKNSSMGPNHPFLQTPLPASVDYVPGYASAAHRVLYEGMPDSLMEYYRTYAIQAGQVMSEFGEFIEKSDTAWTWIDQHVRSELANWTAHPFYYSIVNYVTNRMLWFQFIGASAFSAEKKEALQYYVNLAIQYNNPDAELLSRSLMILHENNFWPTSRVKTAADSASGFAQYYLDLEYPDICNCEDSEGSTAQYIQDAKSAQQLKFNLILDAKPVLDSLAAL
jgi:hypothetical protein